MTSHMPRARGRALIPVLVVLLGVAVGIGGVLLLRSSGTPAAAGPPRRSGPASAAAGTARPVNERAIYQRVEPSVVDVTSTLRYDAETSSGMGFIVDGRTALVLTNNHVIRDATAVTARLTATGRTYAARIVGADVGADIAVLQLQGVTGLTAAPAGGATVAIGTPVLAIGTHGGEGAAPSMALGVIDNLDRTIQANDGASGFTEVLRGMLQTSAQIEPGDSGGPLVDAAGMVIGMDTATGAGTPAAGYAIPIGVALAVERQIAAGRPASGITVGVSGFLGVVVPATATQNPRLQAQQQQQGPRTGGGGSARSLGCAGTEAGVGVPAKVAPARSGALVDGVLCGTGAAAAGISAGDVIVAAAGRPVSSPDALTAVISRCQPGVVVPVTWVSTAGNTRTSLIRLDVAPAA